jgi:uncharacterized membrane protein YkvA (DUF1232 family)
MALIASVKNWARLIKRDVLLVYFAARDPATPLMVRMLAFAIGAYALSPIDLIPDFIPVFGYLDDLIIVPLGILFVVRLLPVHVLIVAREKADGVLERPSSKVVAFFIVCIWLLCTTTFAYWLLCK